MTVSLCPMPKMQFFNNLGLPLNGGYLYTYEPSLPGVFKATYTDFTGLTTNTNPIVLDSAGRANIWLNGAYYMELWTGEKSLGTSTLLWAIDGVSNPSQVEMPITPLTGSGVPSSTPLYIGMEYLDTLNSKWYKAKGVSSSSDWVILN